ncbi:MAG: putative cysteine desulfurase [Deltaproteobacteria bacterium]|jgi:cysteine desulfurase family protein (TIGR01976 family)|nr:putative cysteine desulfurase [Deltaproteobacteria bacterium]
MSFEVNTIREHFPALSLKDEGKQRIYLDNPGGTQVPRHVLRRMENYLINTNANHAGMFRTSVESDKVLEEAHQGMADLLNAKTADEIVFGANMTTLTFAVSRSIGRLLNRGDSILLTQMDHDGNIGPWLHLAEDLGLDVKWLKFNTETYEYDLNEAASLLSENDIKLAAINYASNCTGTINDVKSITEMAHRSEAMVFVDAVQYVPHGPTDVQDLGCDLLVCSPYKFFGPHQGVLWGKSELLGKLEAYKVRPADNVSPGKFETGTQSHEGQAGTLGVIEYLEWVGDTMGTDFQGNFPECSGRRKKLHAAMSAIQQYEQFLSSRLIEGLQKLDGVEIRGISMQDDLSRRVPTVSFTVKNKNPQTIAQKLADENIFVWHGHNYALEAIQLMKLEDSGGVVRIGPVHYNTVEEIDLTLDVLKTCL